MIDPSTQLAALIRAQFGAQLRAQAKPLAGGAAAARQAKPEGSKAPGNDADVRELVAMRVRALSPDDPQRQRKAFRLFLESVLMQAFGRDRLDALGFDRMVDTVLQRMESDADLGAALREAGDLLLADTQPDQDAGRR
jgi:hypothetical protein